MYPPGGPYITEQQIYGEIVQRYTARNGAAPNKHMCQSFREQAQTIARLADPYERQREIIDAAEGRYQPAQPASQSYHSIPRQAPIFSYSHLYHRANLDSLVSPDDSISSVGGSQAGRNPRPSEAGSRTSHQHRAHSTVSGLHGGGGSVAGSRSPASTLAASEASRHSKSSKLSNPKNQLSQVGGSPLSTHSDHTTRPPGSHASSHRSGGAASNAMTRYSSSSKDPKGSGRHRGDTTVTIKKGETTTHKILGVVPVKKTKSTSFEYDRRGRRT